eukprot:jgi/Psemu1/46286/gm1.46286_g
MDQLGTPKTSNPAPVGNNNSQQQQTGGRSRNRNHELKGIVIDGSKSVQYYKLYEGLKIVSGKKNSKVKATLINMERLTGDDLARDCACTIYKAKAQHQKFHGGRASGSRQFATI